MFKNSKSILYKKKLRDLTQVEFCWTIVQMSQG